MSEPKPTHIDPVSLPFTPLSPAASPSAVVKLTLLHCGELITRFVQFRQRDTPEEMKEQEVCVLFCWTVEKTWEDGKVERWLWDAGLVSDINRCGPAVAEYANSRSTFNIPPSAQLPELLKHLSPAPATLDTLTGLILSHAHLDHAGALDEFPSDLPVIVGPGTRAWVNGQPDELKPVPASFWNHPKFVFEVGEERARGGGKGWEKVGAYDKGWDWFGDGSFWLVQAPGHCPGHMIALARVSTSPDTYVALGGDTCHDRLIYSPFPTPAARSLCACFAETWEGPPGETEGKHTMHTDLPETYKSIARFTRMDMEKNVMCVLAHETQLARELGVDVGQMKQGWEKWKENGWKRAKENGGKIGG